jgi:anaphase-promoting complex subunit 1
MAAVTSLGLHQPTGLQYAIREGILPTDPPRRSYTWYNHCDGDSSSSFDDDELLVTPRCVIWSRGGVFRKSYKFDLENEPVTQALMTTFPSVGPLVARDGKPNQHSKKANTRSAAVVVFLKTQAHIYFLSGTSHVIHLPFEVESASAAPYGLIIQRKLRIDSLVAASLKFPRVPPNSFVSSQPQPWSGASSQLSTFSIADLGAPKQMPLPNSTLKDLWEPPSLKNDSNWPRLFSLSDPLAEMGLVVAQPLKSEGRGHRRNSTKITALDTAEEILHVSRRTEFSSADSENPLILALTLNRETSMYTVWKLSYIRQESSTRDKQRVASNGSGTSRRRSSFMPGSGTGATTSISNSQQTFTRESFGGGTLGVAPKRDAKQEDLTEKPVDLTSALDPDFDNAAAPRRKSRRVSSMLARADLSASHDRSAFSDLATGHHNVTARRGESLGSQHGRTSIGAFGVNGQSFSQPTHLNHSLNSFLEAPVDELLDELRAGGDFEGFHNMGLDDDEFDALRQEIVLTHVWSVSAEHTNVRYSTQNTPAKSQFKIFTLAAPASAVDDQQGNTIVICVLDSDERKLLVLTLYTKTHKSAKIDPNEHRNPIISEKDVTVVSQGLVTRAPGVIDACKLDDGNISRILVLTETPDGYGELSLQAPWSVLMKVPLPGKFTISNIRNLSLDATPSARREGGFKRVLSKGPRGLHGLRNAKSQGLVDLVDDEGKLHQLHILMQPRNPHVRLIIDVCRAVVPGSRGGEGVLVTWWNVMQWLRLESIDSVDVEWTALVITLFSMVLGLSNTLKPVQNRAHVKRKSRSGLLRSSSGVDLENWEIMQSQETSNGNPSPPWSENRGWQWLSEEGGQGFGPKNDSNSPTPVLMPASSEKKTFLRKHVVLAHEFVSSTLGQSLIPGTLPTAGNASPENRKAALADIVIGLHLLHEEQKLNTTTVDFLCTGAVSLAPVLSQIVRWIEWTHWVDVYDVEEVSMLGVDYDTGSPVQLPPQEPFDCPSIYDWIQASLTKRALMPFLTLPELVTGRLSKAPGDPRDWSSLTPRTLLFAQFFSSMQSSWSPAQFVEALSSAGMGIQLLETLPEAVLAPLQEAIVQCQTEPPTTWSKSLLTMVGREDVNMLLTPGQRPRQMQTTLLVSKNQYEKLLLLTHHRLLPTSQVLMHTQYVHLQQIQSLLNYLMGRPKLTVKRSLDLYSKTIKEWPKRCTSSTPTNQPSRDANLNLTGQSRNSLKPRKSMHRCWLIAHLLFLQGEACFILALASLF